MRRRLLRFLVPAGLTIFAAVSTASAQPIAVDSVNPQYFRFQNQTIPLIGYSAEYVCQIPNINTKICRFATLADPGNYQSVLDDLASSPGINKIRLWVGLNHSPGKKDQGSPYAHEQPFAWNSAQGKWDLDTWDSVYFQNLRSVIAYAASKSPPIVVEVTLLDPWQGNFSAGPWNAANNLRGLGFTLEKYFASFEAGTTDSAAGNLYARGRQIALIDKVSDELDSFDNVFFEIANEADIDPLANGVTGSQVATWHAAMTQELASHEASQARRHLIATDFFTDAAFSTVRSTTNANRLASVVSGHYIEVSDLDTDGNGSLDLPRHGAISMIQRYHNADANELNRVFGFNETKAICCVGNPSSPDAARAEAWEFMLNEGGMVDHYSLDRTTAAASLVRTYLRKLSGYLAGFNLRNVQRVKAGTSASPPWMGYLGPQNLCSATPLGTTTCINWASFSWPGQQYGLYVHRGQPSGNTYAHYTVPAAGSFTVNLSLNNLGSAGTFKYDWIEPTTGAVKCAVVPCTGTFAWSGSGSVSLASPPYSFDIALRLTRQ